MRARRESGVKLSDFSRILSSRIGSVLVCVGRNAQLRELNFLESTRLVLSIVVMIGVLTDGPIGCLVYPPPHSPQNIQSPEISPAGRGACFRTAHRPLLATTAVPIATIPGAGIGWRNHRKSRRNKKTRRDSYPGPRWKGPSCRDGLSPSRTFLPLALPSPAVSLLALLSSSAMLLGPLLSRAGGARSMPPNPAQMSHQ